MNRSEQGPKGMPLHHNNYSDFIENISFVGLDIIVSLFMQLLVAAALGFWCGGMYGKELPLETAKPAPILLALEKPKKPRPPAPPAPLDIHIPQIPAPPSIQPVAPPPPQIPPPPPPTTSITAAPTPVVPKTEPVKPTNVKKNKKQAPTPPPKPFKPVDKHSEPKPKSILVTPPQISASPQTIEKPLDKPTGSYLADRLAALKHPTSATSGGNGTSNIASTISTLSNGRAGGGTPSGSNGSGSVGGSNNAVVSYLATIRKRLEAAKRYPEDCRRNGYEGTVTLSFKIDSGGKPTDADVAGEAHELLKAAALKLLTSCKFPKPPKGWDTQAQIEIPIKYYLK